MAAIQDTSNKNFKKFNNKKHFPLRGMWQILKNFDNKYKKENILCLVYNPILERTTQNCVILSL
jgi:hypothetical protein